MTPNHTPVTVRSMVKKLVKLLDDINGSQIKNQILNTKYFIVSINMGLQLIAVYTMLIQI